MRLALSWMDDPGFVAAALPLLQEGALDALEWSFDTAWHPSEATAAVLDAFAAADALYGHGVSFSLLSARFTPRQQAWLHALEAEVAHRSYRHITEHLAFATAGDRVDGAPLPCPVSDDLIRVGVERLQALRDAAGVPVGLENLALALGPQDVADEGALMEAILGPVDGLLLLDLHNLWCRAVNFDQDVDALVNTYPLERVREIHVSGGSWDAGFRRDTHDDVIPDAVLDLLRRTLPRCPSAELVVVERLPRSPWTGAPVTAAALDQDVRRVREVLDA